MDITSSVLHGDLNEEVYMMPPKRYRGQNVTPGFSNFESRTEDDTLEFLLY